MLHHEPRKVHDLTTRPGSRTSTKRRVRSTNTDVLDGIEETIKAGGSSLNYDSSIDQYDYVWKTDKSWAGTCRQLVVKLTDGTSHWANFKFTK
jgi:hypothetical protein